jgi:hypothetical protein
MRFLGAGRLLRITFEMQERHLPGPGRRGLPVMRKRAA